MYDLAVIVHQKETGDKKKKKRPVENKNKQKKKHGYLVHLHRYTKKVG